MFCNVSVFFTFVNKKNLTSNYFYDISIFVMALQGWTVEKAERKDIRAFIELWHYSKNINGCISDYCFALFSPDHKMKGAMFFGRMAMCNQWKRFSDCSDNVIELRRLCCVDDTPRNAESFFIGKSLRLLRRSWRRRGIVVSYADKDFGHTGVIYKATNFKLVGETPCGKIIMYNGKRYHDKAIRTKYKGVLKPFAQNIKAALLSGQAYYKKTAGKYIYVYQL